MRLFIYCYFSKSFGVKKQFFIGALLLTGCFNPELPEFRAQVTVENYLDTVNLNNKVDDKSNIGFYKIADYLNASKKDNFNRTEKQEIYRSLVYFNHASTNEWTIFTGKVDDLLSNIKENHNGYILLENYKLKRAHFTTAFFVDSSCTKILSKIEFCGNCEFWGH